MTKFILVTGAFGGIGQCLVKSLSLAGWSVVCTDNISVRCPDFLSKYVYQSIPANLEQLANSPDELNRFRQSVHNTTETYGLSAIVHNAAYQYVSAFNDISASNWHKSFNINVIAPALISNSFLADLSKNSGSIVHIGSIHSHLSKPKFTAYASSKAALVGLTRSMAVELGKLIRVNAIEPAAISTSMLEAGFSQEPAMRAELDAFHPTGTIGTPSDVSRAVLFLLDPSNTFLNGCVLPLGGGIHNRLHDPV